MGERTPKRGAGGAQSSAGDPARTLSLLWRQPGDGRASRGPRQRTTVDAVVTAAIEVADSEGLSALTIRSVAAGLGITPMATYTYVAGKAELLDLMLDTVYQQMPRATLSGMAWREKVSVIAEENRGMFERHPWVASVATTRPPLGPGMMAKYEHELLAFDGVGLSDVEMDAALTYVLGFVTSVARIAIDTDRASADSGVSDRDWWERAAPLLADVLDAERFPLATRVGAAAGERHGSAYSAAHAYEFGLARVLDGLAALIDGR
ncbi:TetR/AcrR family transcriptional regulator C-terminal domain-containing protein [Mycolicibacterium hippocampi]|uniref:Transcriptional regulator, AcrR family n=1 Tax=Mycolicibacterium hippocampi TaxID=659824 RepID=A0A850PUA5_9MYCO|nr:TetR/AcrR family transcriptional regulator C-terminal domain-containing protein [Mycolicibacterium hippocampi]NVN51156.1 Transcriptional regulator, AcrR family [Mycolicibacterium hippocampi]